MACLPSASEIPIIGCCGEDGGDTGLPQGSLPCGVEYNIDWEDYFRDGHCNLDDQAARIRCFWDECINAGSRLRAAKNMGYEGPSLDRPYGTLISSGRELVIARFSNLLSFRVGFVSGLVTFLGSGAADNVPSDTAHEGTSAAGNNHPRVYDQMGLLLSNPPQVLCKQKITNLSNIITGQPDITIDSQGDAFGDVIEFNPDPLGPVRYQINNAGFLTASSQLKSDTFNLGPCAP